MAESQPLVNDYNRYKSSGSPDSNYLASIEKYRSEAWYDRLLENPWLASKQADFTPSFWQSIGEAFGDESARNNYYAQLAQNSSQWLSDTLAQYHQQDYDSASAQAMRERAAGLNPDINGQITPGSAAENDQPLSNVSFPNGSDIESVGKGAFSFLSFILQGAQALQGLEQGSQNLVAMELGNNQSAMDYVINHRALSSRFSNYTPSQLDAVSDDEIIAAIKEEPLTGYSKRTKRYLQRLFREIKPDSLAVRDIRERLMAQIRENQEKRVKIEGSPTYSEDFQSWVNEYAKKIGNFEFESWKIQQKAQRMGWSADYTQSKLNKLQTDAMYDMYDFVRGGNKWYNSLGIIGLPMLNDALKSFLSKKTNTSLTSSTKSIIKHRKTNNT